MPYILNESRASIDTAVTELVRAINQTEAKTGATNYAITRLVNQVFSSPTYQSINDIIGVLQSCSLEVYRRRAAPYEDQKCYDNGDVSEYEPV